MDNFYKIILDKYETFSIFISLNKYMKTIEQLKKEIAGLEAKYQASTSRNAYKLGDQLREKKQLLTYLLNTK